MSTLICDYLSRLQFDPEQPWTKEEEQKTTELCRSVSDLLYKKGYSQQTYLEKLHLLSKAMTGYTNAWKKANKKAYKKYADTHPGSPAAARKIALSLLRCEDADAAMGSTSIPCVKSEIIGLKQRHHDHCDKVAALKEKAEEAFERGAKDYWTDNAAIELAALLNKQELWVERPELVAEIQTVLDQNAELRRVQDIDSKQQFVFKSYLDQHLSEVSDEKRSDVEKNGWH